MNTAIKNKIKMAILKEIPMTGLMEEENVLMVIEHTLDTLIPVLKLKDGIISILASVAFIIGLFHFV